MSAGSTLIFVDADCRFEPGCLARLGSLVNQSPRSCFQLHVVGDRSGVIGKAEELRLATLQSYLLQSDGCIRYLNTAGFAIRKEEVNANGKLFNPAALRAEDTLLLATVMKQGRLPFFVNAAETSLRCCVLGCRLKGAGAYNAIINQKQKSICQTVSLALSYKNSSPSKRMSSSGGKD